MQKQATDIASEQISCFDAVRALHQRIKVTLAGDDNPAPWCKVDEGLVACFGNDNPQEYVRNQKLHDRTKLAFSRAMLAGELQARFVDGVETREIPGWAWANPDCIKHVWFEGRLPLDIFLPGEWRRWSCHQPYIDQSTFDAWLGSEMPSCVGSFPELPTPIDIAGRPQAECRRAPPNTPFVSLSEALSWIAFGFALNRDELDHALNAGEFGGQESAQLVLADATRRLLVPATGGNVGMRGKYIDDHSLNENQVLTENIPAIRFADFGQFDILRDGLRYGTGLTWVKHHNSIDQAFSPSRKDAFRSVTVKRDDLLRLFPAQAVAMTTEVESSLSKPASNNPLAVSHLSKRHGRTIGSGSMAEADKPLLDKMRTLIEENKAFSPNGAATLVWRDAVGNGSENSKITRLAKRYIETERNSSA
jgi:hypothetical protein